MSLLLHAVASTEAAVALAGPRGARPRWVAAGRLGIWATDWVGERRLEPADLLAHHALVETLCAAGPCLPVRLGSWVADEVDARKLVSAREAALLAALERVGGRRELALTLVWREAAVAAVAAAVPARVGLSVPAAAVPADAAREPAAPRPAAGVSAESGRAYLERRRAELAEQEQRERRAGELASLVEAALGVGGEDARHRPCPEERVALSSALLVPFDEAEALAARARALAIPDVEVVVSGPWPPYSFVEL